MKSTSAANNISDIINYICTELDNSDTWHPYSFISNNFEHHIEVYTTSTTSNELVLYGYNQKILFEVEYMYTLLGQTMGSSNLYNGYTSFCGSQDLYYNNSALQLSNNNEIIDLTEYFNYSTICELPSYEIYEFIMMVKNNLPSKVKQVYLNLENQSLDDFINLKITNTRIQI